MNKPINVLLIEDGKEDFKINRDIVKEINGGQYHLDCVPSFAEGLKIIKQQKSLNIPQKEKM